jgi:hypothetical protein
MGSIRMDDSPFRCNVVFGIAHSLGEGVNVYLVRSLS